MDIYLIEKDYNKYKYLELYFNTYTKGKIKVVNTDLKTFLTNNKVQCVVSPANSFGLMDGGYDLELTNWYGNQLQERVQQYIIDNYYGEQPVGTSFIIETNKDNQYLIHTPTMRTPEEIVDARIIYQCMRTTLIVAKQNNIDSILIPMFGAHTGNVKPQIVAKMMLKAYQQINNPPSKIDWNYAEIVDMLPEEDFHNKLEQKEVMIMKQLYEINEKATEFYHNQLYNYTVALDYLKTRYINNNTIIDLKIGYASDDNSLYSYLKEEGYTDDVILASGLCSKKEDDGFTDRYKNRIIFPIINEENKVIAFGGRVLDDSKPKYVNSPENIIYSKGRNLYGINIAKDYAQDGLILVEGYIDFVTFYQAGIKNVVSVLGTAIVTAQAELIKKYTNKVIIVFDSDMAGTAAVLRAGEIFRDLDIEIKVVELNEAKDPDEYIRKYGANKFKKLLNNSIPYFEFKGKYILKKDDGKNYFQIGNENEIIDEISKYIDIKQVSYKLYRGNCPFCGDVKGLSMSIEKQIYHSFCCGKGGKIEKLLEEIKELK